jgi:glutamyl-tRNA synthetase
LGLDDKIKAMREVRVRFAPSPTGFLHIGGLRTALYSYAFAKSHQGKFILRIEDTDRTRFVPGATEKLYEVLKKFGLRWDEGPLIGGPHAPYIQSERVATGIYKKYAEKLVADGQAYYCFCPPKSKAEIKKAHEQRLIELRDSCRDQTVKEGKAKISSGAKQAIRLRVPNNENVSFYDFVLRKEISWDTKDVDEVMLLKSDGFPTYHLAVTVDDAVMGITHITRAHEWLASTPVHLLLFKYLGFELPQIGHLTDILDPSGGKLSKRRGDIACEEFLAQGYLPEAILNFIMLLGWAPKDNRELFTLKEFVENFPKGELQTANPVFNRVKLDWFNGVYIRKKSDKELVQLIKPFLKAKINDDLIKKIIPLVKDRLVKLTDFEPLVSPILNPPKTYDQICLSMIKKDHLKKAIEVLSAIVGWKLEEINQRLTDLIDKNNWKTGDFYMSLRVAICGSKVTPPINETIEILGQEGTLSRLKKALALISPK